MSKLVSVGNEAAIEIQKTRFDGDPSSGSPSFPSGLADYFISADVFVYVGELSEIFHLIKTKNKRK